MTYSLIMSNFSGHHHCHLGIHLNFQLHPFILPYISVLKAGGASVIFWSHYGSSKQRAKEAHPCGTFSETAVCGTMSNCLFWFICNCTHPTFQEYIISNTGQIFLLAVIFYGEDVVSFKAVLFVRHYHQIKGSTIASESNNV
jgi:hypothetical protein